MKSFQTNLLILVLLLSTLGFLKELKADDAKVLPKNRWRVQLISSFSYADERFNSSGQSVSIGDAYSLSLTPAFVSMLRPQVKALSTALDSLQPGLSQEMKVTEINADIQSLVNANAVAAEYGVSDRLSVGFILPVVYGSVRVSTESQATPEFEGFMKKLPDAHPLKAALQQMKSQLSIDGINQTITQDLGYQSGLKSWSGTGLGDLEVGAKYQYLNIHPFRMTVKTGFRAPTGRRDNPDLLFDLGFGDGQWDLAGYHYIDYVATSKLYLSWEAGYTVQLPHRATYRVPVFDGVALSPVKTKLDRNPGDIIENSLEANFNFTRLLSISPKYRHRYKFADSYSGATGINTSLLGANTKESLHEATMTLGFSNLPRVKSGESQWPMDAQIFYRQRIAGRNMSETMTGGLQLKAYF
jgi:hypothetical protein